MKLYLFSFLIIISLPSFSKTKMEKYVDFRKKFYLLEEQEFSKISCRLSNKTISMIVDNMKNKFANSPDFKVKENYSDIRLTYIKDKGLNFSKGSFDIIVINPEKVLDKKVFEEGMKQVKQGLNQIEDGTKAILGIIFSEFQIDAKTKKIDDFKKVDNKYEIKMTVQKTPMLLSLNGQSLTREEFISSGKTITNSNYEMYENKLLFKDLKMTVNGGLMKTNIDISIEYHQIEGVKFPKKITQNTIQIMKNSETKNQFVVELNECQLTK